jgi:hypothetical protein
MPKPKHAKLEKYMFLSTYASIPEYMRDKPCGLSWNDVYFLLKENCPPKQNMKNQDKDWIIEQVEYALSDLGAEKKEWEYWRKLKGIIR